MMPPLLAQGGRCPILTASDHLSWDLES